MSTKFKVVQISSVHPAFDTRIFHKVSKSLVRAGYDVDLIIQHKKNEIKGGVNLIKLPIAKKKWDRVIKVIPQLFYKCVGYPKKTIFHFHDPELIPMGMLLKLFGYKVVYDAHENTPKDFLTKEWFNPRIRVYASKLIEVIEYLADKYLDAIVTTSTPISERYTNTNLYEVRNYPILDDKYQKARLSDTPKKNQIIYIGDITYRRGIKEMITGMDLLDESIDTRLVLGGRFSPESIFEEVIALNGWEKCDFLGWLSLEEVWRNLSDSKIGLVTIQANQSHFTQLPVKLFEYMAAGIPVICSDFPMYREIVESSKCGILVDPSNPREIADAITRLLNNQSEAKEMGENGKKAAFNIYNWESEAKKLLNLYTSLIQKK